MFCNLGLLFFYRIQVLYAEHCYKSIQHNQHTYYQITIDCRKTIICYCENVLSNH